jgi:hypothetical protein
VCGQSKDDILWLDTIDFCRSSHRQAAAICCWSRLEVDVTLEIGSPLGFSRSTQRLTDALLKRLDALTHEPPRDIRRLHFLGTAQDASRPPWSGKSCADLAFEQCPGEQDRWVRIAVDPDIPLVLRVRLGTWWWR